MGEQVFLLFSPLQLLFSGICDRLVSNEYGTTLRPFDVNIQNHKKGNVA